MPTYLCHLPTYTYLPTYLPTHPPTYLTYLPTYLPTYLSTYPPGYLYLITNPPTYPSYLCLPTYTYLPIYPPTYLPNIPTHLPTRTDYWRFSSCSSSRRWTPSYRCSLQSQRWRQTWICRLLPCVVPLRHYAQEETRYCVHHPSAARARSFVGKGLVPRSRRLSPTSLWRQSSRDP